MTSPETLKAVKIDSPYTKKLLYGLNWSETANHSVFPITLEGSDNFIYDNELSRTVHAVCQYCPLLNPDNRFERDTFLYPTAPVPVECSPPEQGQSKAEIVICNDYIGQSTQVHGHCGIIVHLRNGSVTLLK